MKMFFVFSHLAVLGHRGVRTPPSYVVEWLAPWPVIGRLRVQIPLEALDCIDL